MAFNFSPPASPSLNQIYSPAVGYNWIWNGNQWEPYVPALSVAPATTGSFDAGSATVYGTNPITISAVTPVVPQFSLVNTVGAVGTILVSTGNTGTWVSNGTTGQVLQANTGGLPTWATVSSLALPTALYVTASQNFGGF